MKIMLSILSLLILASCQQKQAFKTTGSIERLQPSLDAIISADAKIEIIAEGFEWSEGPLWLEKQKRLIFSDVPRDTVYQWSEKNGLSVYLTPSGYTGSAKRGGEMGSNGLLLDNEGRLVLCQHGNRQMARMDAPLDNASPRYVAIASQYQGRQFDSPNDATYNSAGELFFTDPPYGLEKQTADPAKQIPFQGVYKVKTNGEVVLLVDSLTRPNGIALMPGASKLVVANSDPEKPYWYQFDLGPGDSLSNPRIFYDASAAASTDKGLPDGFKFDSKGNMYASGPGGIWIFNKDAQVLGKIRLTEAASNCALSADEKTLYITNDMYVLRIKMRD